MSDLDLEWLEQKRREVVRNAERLDQRNYDTPRFLRIIDELMANDDLVITEIGRILND